MDIKRIFESVKSHPKMEDKNILFLSIHGSRAYATASEDSDYDVKGFYLAESKDFLGLDPMSPESPSINGFVSIGGFGVDFEIHEIGKFFKLITKSNANMFEYLFAPDYEISMSRVDFENIRTLASQCISKQIFHAYLGMFKKNMPRYYANRVDGKLNALFDWNRDVPAEEKRSDIKKMIVMLRSMLSCYYVLANRVIEIDMRKTSRFVKKETVFDHLVRAKRGEIKLDFDLVFNDLEDLLVKTRNVYTFSVLPDDVPRKTIKTIDLLIKEMRIYELCSDE